MKITSKRQTPDNHLYKTFRIVKDPGGDGWNVYDKDGQLFDEGSGSLDDAKRSIDDKLNLGYISGSKDLQDELIANIYEDCSWDDACWEPDGVNPEQTAKIRYVPSLNKYEYISYSKWNDDTWIPSISIKKDTLGDVLEDVRHTFPNHPKHSINVYLTKTDLNAATELSSIDMTKLDEIANRYCGSRPVSGDWATETVHEQNAISNELGVSAEEAKDLMIEYLGFDESQFLNIDVAKVYEFLDECGGYSDYNQKVEDVMYEFGVDSETAENLVWNWTRRSDVGASVIMSTDSGDVYDTLEELSKCGIDINRRSDVIEGLKTYFRYGRDEIREFLRGYKDYLKSVRNGSRLAVASTDIECYSYAGTSVPLKDIRVVAKAAADVITADDLAKVVSSLKLIDQDYWKDVIVAWNSKEYSPAALGKIISDDLYNQYLSVDSSKRIQSSTYVDVDGIIGEPGEAFNTAELKNIYDDLHNYDPVVMDYDSFADWLNDSIKNGYLDVDVSQSVKHAKNSITAFEETEYDPDIMFELARELKDACHQVMTSEDYGWPEDEVDNYLAVEIEPTTLYGDPYYLVEIRAELSYAGMEELVDACNPIVENYDPQAYFDHVTTGIIDAYIRMKTSVDSSTSIESADNSDEAVDEILEQLPQEFTSENTSINSTKLPAIFKLVHFEPGTINLDYGGGKFDNVADYLTQYDVVNLVYDPYNRSEEHNSEVVRLCKSQGGADTATCSNVLNVIKEPEVRLSVLRNMAKLVKPSGTIYITVYEGSGSGSGGETKSGYQLNRKTADYLDEIHEVFPDAVRKGKLIIAHPSNAVTSSEDIEAALVEPPQEVVDELISLLNDYGFVLDDRFAVNPGKTWMGNTHLQVINPDSHVDESADNLRDYVPRSMIDRIHQLEDSFNCPITWNFGPDEDGHVTGGLDIDKQWVPDDSIQSASNSDECANIVEGVDYGGAFDIDPEQFFTRDEYVEFAYEVEDRLNDMFGRNYNIHYTDVYALEPNTICIEIEDKDGNMFTWNTKIDLRKIRKPSDLIDKYAPIAVSAILEDMKQWYSEYPIESSQTVESNIFRMPERNVDPPDYTDNNLEDIDDTIEFTLKGTLHVSDEDDDWSFELPDADSYAKDVLYEYEDFLYDLVDEVDIEEETEYLLTSYIPAESGDYDFEADIKLAYEITDLWENAYGEIISDDASINFIYKKSDVNLKKCKKLD